jgi:hypothetical protein
MDRLHHGPPMVGIGEGLSENDKWPNGRTRRRKRRVGESGVCARPARYSGADLTCSWGGGDASKSARQPGEMAETHNVIRPLGRCTAADGGGAGRVHDDARAGRRRESSLPPAALPGPSSWLFVMPRDVSTLHWV